MSKKTSSQIVDALVKSLDFTKKSEYFDYCIESYINGNRSQCRELFKKLPHCYQHILIQYIRDYSSTEIEQFYVNLF